MSGEWLFAFIELVASELALFAAIGLLVGGIDDLVVDVLWIVRAIARRRIELPSISSGTTDYAPMAVFIPAWDEAEVIGSMLRHTLYRFEGQRFRLFVGCYPNDSATIEAVQEISALDDRVEPVLAPLPGPTTKADCLNALWTAMLAREQAHDMRFSAVILHDAEDVVHSGEIPLFAGLIGDHDLIQLPVAPLVDRRSRWVGGHYCDEFAEAHGKDLIVRRMLNAGLPMAGVGCAITRDMLGEIAEERDGAPFDADTLTEDYELGLRVAERGGRGAFVRARSGDHGASLVAVCAHFPETLSASIRQKKRWITGIALMGWDRLGWRGGPAEIWMRLRDRRAIVAAVILLAAYLAFALWLGLVAAYFIDINSAPAISPGLLLLFRINAAMLAWRLVVRSFFTARAYGWREGLRAIPRALVSNLIAMIAAGRAFVAYVFAKPDDPLRWDKTRHIFPSDPQ